MFGLTYAEFTKKVGDKKFCKFINDKKKHYNFRYKEGLNEDTIQFNPSGNCKSGGLYFTDIENAKQWNDFGIYIVFIELCKDAQFYIEPCGTKYKTNKFIIHKFINLNLKETEEQTEDICKLAVQKNVNEFHFVKEQTEEICKLAVQKNGIILYNVKEQTEDICKLAVQQNIYALKYIKEQTDEICKLAV